MRPYRTMWAWILAGCICLSGCAQFNSDTLSTEVEGSIAQSLPLFSTPKESNPENGDVSYHMSQVLCENLTIDADVTFPPQTEYTAYQLKNIDRTPGRLMDIFCPDGHGSFTLQAPSYPGETNLVYSGGAGETLVVSDTAIQYRAYGYGTDSPMQEIANLMYYYTTEHPDAQPHDLSFMTVTEMEAFGLNILNQLGTSWEPVLSKCVALSGQEILDFQEEMFAGSTYGATYTPEKLAEADDTCYLEFTFSCDGIPILNRDEPSISSYSGTLATSDASASLLLNAQGIQDITVLSPYTVSPSGEPQPILTLEAAIACLQEEYSENVPFESLTVTDIWLEYIPFTLDHTMRMEPYWCFAQIDETRVGYMGYRGNADRIHAISGTNLAYGG